MKVKVTIYKKPLVWDSEPDEICIYDLENKMEKTFYLKSLTNIDSNEYMTIEEYNETEE